MPPSLPPCDSAHFLPLGGGRQLFSYCLNRAAREGAWLAGWLTESESFRVPLRYGQETNHFLSLLFFRASERNGGGPDQTDYLLLSLGGGNVFRRNVPGKGKEEAMKTNFASGKKTWKFRGPIMPDLEKSVRCCCGV